MVHSVMAAPLLIGRRLVGALACCHSDPTRVFDEDDLRRLNMFAPPAAIAIENARLYTVARRERQYLETLVFNIPCHRDPGPERQRRFLQSPVRGAVRIHPH
jgi:transcriptional regulator with GAF, ATPase, and Fis domain